MLQKFLEKKPLYYDVIDYSRMPRIYASVKEYIAVPKIIHLVGTNGKGTTGRFLASALHSLGYSTGHYTSPHILKFNERVWLNAKNISSDKLNEYHKRLLTLLSKEDADALSYFEYTTLLAVMIFSQCDFLVFEAGLGGEHDATTVFDNILTLVTPIDKDHEAFLGESIQEIARTKLHAIKSQAILAPQKYKEVREIADEIANKRNVTISSYEKYLEKRDLVIAESLSVKLNLVPYLKENLLVAISALKLLNISYSEENFYNSRLFGRLTQISENIVLDVGHNELAAKKVAESLKEEKYILVYNTYKDKNYKKILALLKPIIEYVEIIDINDERVESRELLEEALRENMINYREFSKIDSEKKYLIFGSFSVAEAFLKGYIG
ncbi:bifunctional folylpolyglutamate synthase/dihydrofolate synthase [Sulfurimonas sp.]